MALLTEQEILKIADEIKGTDEINRRALAKRRQDIYKDGGKKFLLEQIKTEFGPDAVKEMRLTPINFLKKVINKLSTIYKEAPVRKCELESDQILLDYYVEELEFNQKMQKVNRYYNLHSNTAMYFVPIGNEIEFMVIPPYLYSLVSNPINPLEIKTWIFSAFIEEGSIAPNRDNGPATGNQSFSRDQGQKTQGDMVDSQEKQELMNRQLIFWSDEEHFTTNENGDRIKFNSEAGNEQFLNPIMMCPIVNVTKDRDAETWATQGEDLVDLSIALQLGWTDLLTIAKHQGFGIMTMTSKEQPKQMNIGINKTIWLKQGDDGVAPTVDYINSAAPLDKYNALLMDLLGLMLTTNDMTPQSVSGNQQPQTVLSGFSRLIQMSDTIEAVEADKPVLKDAEKEGWEIIKAWHNFMYDSNILSEEARALGKFSDQFDPQILYKSSKPIESEDEILARIEKELNLGLITKKDALAKLNPNSTTEQLDAKIQEIDQEKQDNIDKFQQGLDQQQPQGDMSGNQQEN